MTFKLGSPWTSYLTSLQFFFLVWLGHKKKNDLLCEAFKEDKLLGRLPGTSKHYFHINMSTTVKVLYLLGQRLSCSNK